MGFPGAAVLAADMGSGPVLALFALLSAVGVVCGIAACGRLAESRARPAAAFMALSAVFILAAVAVAWSQPETELRGLGATAAAVYALLVVIAGMTGMDEDARAMFRTRIGRLGFAATAAAAFAAAVAGFAATTAATVSLASDRADSRQAACADIAAGFYAAAGGSDSGSPREAAQALTDIAADPHFSDIRAAITARGCPLHDLAPAAEAWAFHLTSSEWAAAARADLGLEQSDGPASSAGGHGRADGPVGEGGGWLDALAAELGTGAPTGP